MTKDDAIKQFRRIYPELEISAFFEAFNPDKKGEASNFIVTADFPDGTFYFIVTENSVSSSYNTREDAIRSIR